MPQEGGLWSDASALAVAVGSVTEAITYTKSASLHLWLLGYEFTGAAGAGQSVVQMGAAGGSNSTAPACCQCRLAGGCRRQAAGSLRSPEAAPWHVPSPRPIFPACRDGAGLHQD